MSKEPTVTITLRMPQSLYTRIQERATADDRSFNRESVRRLQDSFKGNQDSLET